MQRLLILLGLSLLIWFISSCDNGVGNTQGITVQVNPKTEVQPKPLSDIIEDVHYTHLKAGNMSSVVGVDDVKYFEGHYYILDKFQNAIIKFDTEGNYVDKFQHLGDGPGEYRKIDFFDINEKHRTVEIYDVRKGSIIRYDLFGNFKKGVRVTLICRDFKVTPKGDYLFYSPDELNNFNHSTPLKPGLIHVNRNGNKAKLILALGDQAFAPIMTSRSLIRFDSELFLFSNYTDTIYQIDEDIVVNKVFIDYGKRIDNNLLLNPNFDINNSNSPFLKLNPVVTPEFISFTFLYRGKDKTVFIDRSDFSTQLNRGIVNDLDSGFFALNGGLQDKSTYISILTSEMAEAYKEYYSGQTFSDSSSYRLSILINEMEVNNQNPVLVKAKLKQ